MMQKQTHESADKAAALFTVDGCAFWDVKAVAAFLGLSLASTYRLCSRPDFPQRYRFTPHIVRWKRAEVEQWADRLTPANLSIGAQA